MIAKEISNSGRLILFQEIIIVLSEIATDHFSMRHVLDADSEHNLVL